MEKDYLEYLRKASILLVGAGGIGCEVIKNLMLNGVTKLTIVDMDTIDVSNLNRQFLYLPEHVNKYKAEVARERALEINPESKIECLVCDVNTWKPNDMLKYDVVLNALDNVKARSHINYCCVQSGVPLIESGSTGYNGQVYPILKDVTKCYDCEPLPKTTAIPVCSIRQIPDKPTHCIAWARMLYQLLFGTPDNNNLLTDLSVPTLPPAENLNEASVVEYINRIFNFLFNSEVESLLKMEKVWKERDPPKPLKHEFKMKTNQEEKVGVSEYKELRGKRRSSKSERSNWSKAMKTNEGLKVKVVASDSAPKGNKFAVLELDELYDQFERSITEILLKNSHILGSATFSKDDEVAVEFVSASANIRMHNFGIKPLSTWEVQSIAGSIVPAIASTNAIVASFQVVQLMHLLKYLNSKEKSFNTSKCRKVWVKSNVMGSNPLVSGKLSQPEELDPPNPNCTTCQQKSVRVKVKSLETTIFKFVDSVIRGLLGLEMVIMDLGFRNIYDGEGFEDDEKYAEAIRKNSLSFYGVTDSSILTVTDLNGTSQFDLVVHHDPSMETDFKLM
ncbi:ubiquitin-activating enzyme E1 [Theileria orientalis]|uniref:SUMO-activating enzyme subunit n=1 Tax=Theileria orientalis TaxID=68886 RepID=A0A976QSY4_THEOR|nr:ubiquitin-activating enzyme E1 [Theileria orientalis]